GGGLVADSEEIPRSAVDRDVEFGVRKAGACNNRLEIAGQKALPLTQARDANGLEIVFEEGASGICIPWPQVYGVTADVPQGAKDLSAIVGTPYLAQSFAAGLISCESGEMIIGPPARELGPLDGLELAAREFQRPLGRCGVGRQT